LVLVLLLFVAAAGCWVQPPLRIPGPAGPVCGPLPVDVLPVPALPCAQAPPPEARAEIIKVALIMLRIYDSSEGSDQAHAETAGSLTSQARTQHSDCQTQDRISAEAISPCLNKQPNNRASKQFC
jgi:hypothetical protein